MATTRKIKKSIRSNTKENISVPNDLPNALIGTQTIAKWFNLIKFSLSLVSWRRSTVTRDAQITPGELNNAAALTTIINNYRDGNIDAWPNKYFPKRYRSSSYVINSIQGVANVDVTEMDAGRIPSILNQQRYDRRWTAGRAFTNYEILRQKALLWNILTMGNVDSNDLIKIMHLSGQLIEESSLGILTEIGCSAFILPSQSVANTVTEVFIGSISHCFINKDFNFLRFVPYGRATNDRSNAFQITKITIRDGRTIINNIDLLKYIDTMRGTYANGYIEDDYLKISISTTSIGGNRIETILSADIIVGSSLKSLRENDIDDDTDSLSLFAFGRPAQIYQQTNSFTLSMDIGRENESSPRMEEKIYLVQPRWTDALNTVANLDTKNVRLPNKVGTTLATSGGFSGCAILKCGLLNDDVKCKILGVNESSQLVTTTSTGTRAEFMNLYAKIFK